MQSRIFLQMLVKLNLPKITWKKKTTGKFLNIFQRLKVAFINNTRWSNPYTNRTISKSNVAFIKKFAECRVSLRDSGRAQEEMERSQ